MTEAIHRLFYRSRQTRATAVNLDKAIGEIIETSIRRNRAVGLTGLLLVVQDHFIQALEGGIDEIRTTYARISMDSRHCDQKLIALTATECRLFGEWSMCAGLLSPSDKAICSVLDGKGDFRPETLDLTSTQRLLTSVAAIQRRALLATLMV